MLFREDREPAAALCPSEKSGFVPGDQRPRPSLYNELFSPLRLLAHGGGGRLHRVLG